MIKPKHTPIRTCVACRSTDAKRGLMRVVRLADGTVCYDSKGRMSGRGAYVCARSECIQQARKQKKLERSLKVSAVPESVYAGLEAQIGDGLKGTTGNTVPTAAAETAPVSAVPTGERVEESGREPQESEE